MEIAWNWYPSPPEMLLARVENGPDYLYECVGTTDAKTDDKGDLLRVWVPDEATPYNGNVVSELEEKHGIFVVSVREARKLDSFTESAWRHSFESDDQADERLGVEA